NAARSSRSQRAWVTRCASTPRSRSPRKVWNASAGSPPSRSEQWLATTATAISAVIAAALGQLGPRDGGDDAGQAGSAERLEQAHVGGRAGGLDPDHDREQGGDRQRGCGPAGGAPGRRGERAPERDQERAGREAVL